MNIDELKKLLKDNNIHFFSYWGKAKLLELASINNLLPQPKEESKEEPKKVRPPPNYERLKKIRTNPIQVSIKDIETEEERKFPSLYKAAQFIDKSPQVIRYYGKTQSVWNNKYKIMLN